MLACTCRVDCGPLTFSRQRSRFCLSFSFRTLMTILCLAPLVTFCWGGKKKKKMEMQIVDLTVLKASRGPLSSSRCFCRNQVRRRDSAAPGGSLQLPAVNFSCILCFRRTLHLRARLLSLRIQSHASAHVLSQKKTETRLRVACFHLS